MKDKNKKWKLSGTVVKRGVMILLGTYLLHRFGYAFFLKKVLDTDIFSAYYGISYWMKQGWDIVNGYYPSLLGLYLLEGLYILVVHKNRKVTTAE